MRVNEGAGKAQALPSKGDASNGEIRRGPSKEEETGEAPPAGLAGSPPSGGGMDLQPRCPKPRKKRSPAVSGNVGGTVLPEFAALFRAPLLAPRLNPPVAGVAAAAVASGGVSRLKPGAVAAPSSVCTGEQR